MRIVTVHGRKWFARLPGCVPVETVNLSRLLCAIVNKHIKKPSVSEGIRPIGVREAVDSNALPAPLSLIVEFARPFILLNDITAIDDNQLTGYVAGIIGC